MVVFWSPKPKTRVRFLPPLPIRTVLVDLFHKVVYNVHYMNYVQMRETLKNKEVSTFSKATLTTALNLTEAAATTLLKRYKNKGYIKNPKRNLYFFPDNPPSAFSLAYKMYAPSYISFETALSLYGIIPEVTYSVVSATSKPTREFIFEKIMYKYLKIKTPAFTGYTKKGDYLIADPEKALVDYLYFVAVEGKTLNDRLDISKLNFQKIMWYAALFQNNNLVRVIGRLYAKH